MIQKQLAIFVENKTGALCKITKIIADCKINLRALCIAETKDYGILRIIVDNPSEALDKLRSLGISVTVNNMVIVKMADHPGSLAEILEVLARHDIGVNYLYAFLSGEQKDTAYVALRIDSDKEQKAVEVLQEKGYVESDSFA